MSIGDVHFAGLDMLATIRGVCKAQSLILNSSALDTPSTAISIRDATGPVERLTAAMGYLARVVPFRALAQKEQRLEMRHKRP